MSVGYKAVQWTPGKRVYDIVLALCIGGYLAAFVVVGRAVWGGDRAISDEILAIRALGTCAILLLHAVLCIGPLARLDRRFLPLLYNRRHLGVATFLIALAHGALVVGYYHGFGRVRPLTSLFMHDADPRVAASLPFQLMGTAALVILFLMAATSHDFWLKNLSARAWKGLHMLIYPAYALVVAHVAFGALQAERHALYAGLLAAGAATVATLHLLAGRQSAAFDRATAGEVRRMDTDVWHDLGSCDEIAEGRARRVMLPGQEPVAVYRRKGRLCAVRGVCAHQGGPLAEGRIIDGCITCPWHGWQYRAEDGCSPPPFTEKIATYRLKRADGRVWICEQALAPGTPTEGA